MKRLVSFGLTIAGLCAAQGTAMAQPLPRQPDAAFLGVMMTKAIVDELRKQCTAAYPELKATIDEAYNAWPFARTTITIKVNGKDYVSPGITSIVEDVRAQYRAGDDARNRRECEGFKGQLEALVQRMPMDTLKAFIVPAKP
jgi:hypothetical protein